MVIENPIRSIKLKIFKTTTPPPPKKKY